MSKPLVAIVGSGASSIYALLACNDMGIIPTIIANPNSLRIQPGSYWLKWLPRNVSRKFDAFFVKVSKIGTREGYISKQWPEHPESYRSSFPDQQSEEFGFNPYEVLPTILLENNRYNFLSSKDKLITDADLADLGAKFDYVFHSFPTEKCKNENSSILKKIPVKVSKISYPSNWVIYDGTPSKFTRVSLLFGHKFIEYPHYETSMQTNREGEVIWVQDIAPTSIAPNMHQIKENVIPIGRFGRMDRRLLSHDSYKLVQGVINDL